MVTFCPTKCTSWSAQGQAWTIVAIIMSLSVGCFCHGLDELTPESLEKPLLLVVLLRRR
ncbi:hypothetical protein EMIT043CA1_20285 [Pseudomonas brassicacearum]